MKIKQLLFSSAAALLLAACGTPPKVEPVIPANAEIEQKVEALLKKMTLEEKIGQMTELVIDVMWDPATRGTDTFAADTNDAAALLPCSSITLKFMK